MVAPGNDGALPHSWRGRLRRIWRTDRPVIEEEMADDDRTERRRMPAVMPPRIPRVFAAVSAIESGRVGSRRVELDGADGGHSPVARQGGGGGVTHSKEEFTWIRQRKICL